RRGLCTGLLSSRVRLLQDSPIAWGVGVDLSRSSSLSTWGRACSGIGGGWDEYDALEGADGTRTIGRSVRFTRSGEAEGADRVRLLGCCCVTRRADSLLP